MKKKKMKSEVKSKGNMYLCEEGMGKKLECKYEVPPMGGFRVLENALSDLTTPQKIYGTGVINESRQVPAGIPDEPSNVGSKPKSFSKED